ncbi:MAG TPA: TIGR02466 family protein [Sphingomonas sp.]|jgi:uncharacterized protein (TIGR02466 family)|nr:TIGR02466 family protein [Sphingomonas sp.]
MTIRPLFVTQLYDAMLDDADLLAELEASVRGLAQDDGAGRRWCKAHGYRGYTSYASLNDLPQRDPAFADLKRVLDRHVARFADACGFDLGGRKLKLDSLWANLLRPGGHHGAHIHPHSVISGTVYIVVPEGAGALKLEDPRLPMLMAAPPRRTDAPEALQTFATVAPIAGTLLLWESWLRHEVTPHGGKGERISVSFNYRWG